ncbi:hypothetical protein C1701_21340 [Actinoalloteichus sp. AHMU CJ021]|uniref:Uncharacterized protein n=1 Tax=Actinoalloteichus caeruleus DSM 43889 TaxID=1120930 RepID=A0ABT1JBC1_ACTCY|nr:hypothetical protein [Actinoalloteichus caeruleus]AUS80455.1 hypothetical protein C1701_21340 [Actinoalloteichus sp. AHMU CJ021]MCP2329795.1 hypothetical protein [Actinoalloteichus caeruleus DSM 43889]
MLGYRMFGEVHGDRDHLVRIVLGQLRSWLRGKGYEADALTPGRSVRLERDVEGALLERRLRDGSHQVRARIREPRGWVTQLTVAVPRRERDRPWLWLDVESPGPRGTSDRRVWTGTPRLATALTEVLDVRDGAHTLRPAPARVGVDDTDWLLTVLADPGRRGLAILAGSSGGDDVEFARWEGLAGRLLNQTTGLATTYVLDPAATEAFNRDAGPAYAVPPWSLRSYRPGLDLTDRVGARQHRLLGLSRIVESDDRENARILGWKAREVAENSPLPGAVLRAHRALEEEMDSLVVAGLSGDGSPAAPARPAVPPPARTAPDDHGSEPVPEEAGEPTGTPRDEPAPEGVLVDRARWTALTEALLAATGSAEVTVESLTALGSLGSAARHARSTRELIAERLRERTSEIDRLREERDLLRRGWEDEQLEHAETAEELLTVETRLRRTLALWARDARVSHLEPPSGDDDARPHTYEELFEHLDKLAHVAFTGDQQITRALADKDTLCVWVGKIWAALVALEDYAAASAEGRCERDVAGYLRDLPRGCRGVSANRHAHNETNDVQNNQYFSSARTFPVPVEVRPEGRAFMGAHFKITKQGMTSPRLHYLDDTAHSGRVYVGYIGRHLPSKRTN